MASCATGAFGTLTGRSTRDNGLGGIKTFADGMTIDNEVGCALQRAEASRCSVSRDSTSGRSR